MAAILALILPGLGYLALGQARRGLYLAVAVLSLIGGGVLIGGIDAIDSREDPLWFGVQALSGPVVVGLDALHQRHFKVVNASNHLVTPFPAQPGMTGINPPSYRKSLARVNDVGMLYIALAGMLNVLAVIDCAWHGAPGGSGDGPSSPRARSGRSHDAAPRIRRAGGSPS